MASSSGQEGFAPPPGDFSGFDTAANAKDLDEAQLLRIFKHFDADGSGTSITLQALRFRRWKLSSDPIPKFLDSMIFRA